MHSWSGIFPPIHSNQSYIVMFSSIYFDLKSLRRHITLSKYQTVPWLDSTLRLDMKLCIKPDDAEYKAYITNFKFVHKKIYELPNCLAKYKDQLNSCSQETPIDTVWSCFCWFIIILKLLNWNYLMLKNRYNLFIHHD